MSKAEDDLVKDNLVRKMTTPPLDPMAQPEVKPGSYEKLNEIAEDLFNEGQSIKEKWVGRGQKLWDSVGKK